MSIQANPEAALLRGAGEASLRLVSELSETIARDRELAKSIFEPGTYVADGSFVFVRNPSLEELARSRRLMVAEIGPDVASLDVLARVCARNPMAWWLIMRAADDSRDGAEPVGFCGYLPLNADGFVALKAGALRARDPDLALIAPRGEDPAALYLWAIVAHGLSDIAGKLIGHAIGLDLYESLPMFGTIGTEAGLAALRRSSKSASDAAALKIGSIFEIKLPQKHIDHQRAMRVWEGGRSTPTSRMGADALAACTASVTERPLGSYAAAYNENGSALTRASSPS